MKTCPFCANDILDAAIKCQYCHERLEPAAPTSAPQSNPPNVSDEAAQQRQAKRIAEYAGWRRATIGLGVIGWLVGAKIAADYGVPWIPFVVCAVIFVPLARIGWGCGDLVRKFAMPSGVFVEDGLGGLMQSRFFWMVGPQIWGVIVASFFCFLLGTAIAGVGMRAMGVEIGTDTKPPPSSTPFGGVASELSREDVKPSAALNAKGVERANELDVLSEEDPWEERLANDMASYSISLEGDRELRFTSSSGQVVCTGGVGNYADITCSGPGGSATCSTDGGKCEEGPVGKFVLEQDPEIKSVKLVEGEIVDVAAHGIRCVDRGATILCIADSGRFSL